MSIGDITSTARGTGARFNTGKPAFELIPLRVIAAYHRGPFTTDERMGMIAALDALGRFQEGGDVECLLDAFRALGNGWSECAQVFDYGRAKYAAWNWSKGMAWSVPIACAARHLQAMLTGEILDIESKLAHRGHVFCNLVMLWTFTRTFIEGDDRPKGML
jgi:hypothetical protein